MCLKNFLKNNFKSSFILFCDDFRKWQKLSMTDKMMSDQVYILIFDVPIYEPVVQWYDHRIWLGRPEFGSWRGQNFDFSNFDSLEVLGRSGVYRHTFVMIFYRPHGLVGERWAIKPWGFWFDPMKRRITGFGHPVKRAQSRTCPRQWSDQPLNLWHVSRVWGIASHSRYSSHENDDSE